MHQPRKPTATHAHSMKRSHLSQTTLSHPNDTQTKDKGTSAPKRSKGAQGFTVITTQGTLDLGQGKGSVQYFPKHIPNKRAVDIFKLLSDHTVVPWTQYNVTVCGKSYPQPRLITYHGDEDTGTYTYSGLKLQPLPFTPLLLELKHEVEALLGTTFNSLLMNMYRDGKDNVGWHADDEKLYAKNSTIASFSFGCSRDFLVRNKQDHDLGYKFVLGAGDLLVMQGAMQTHWQHSVPKRKGQNGVRINCTFRTIVKPE